MRTAYSSAPALRSMSSSALCQSAVATEKIGNRAGKAKNSRRARRRNIGKNFGGYNNISDKCRWRTGGAPFERRMGNRTGSSPVLGTNIQDKEMLSPSLFYLRYARRGRCSCERRRYSSLLPVERFIIILPRSRMVIDLIRPVAKRRKTGLATTGCQPRTKWDDKIEATAANSEEPVGWMNDYQSWWTRETTVLTFKAAKLRIFKTASKVSTPVMSDWPRNWAWLAAGGYRSWCGC